MRVVVEVSFDTDEDENDRHVTYAVMTLLGTAVPYMADNVEIIEIDGGA
jgi:hypothetical protein